MHAHRSRTAILVSVLVLGGGLAVGSFLACATGASPQQGTGDDASTESGGFDSSSSSGSSSGGGGCDAQTMTDKNNCGACGKVCPMGNICVASQCQLPCSSPTQVCPGVPGCFDLTSDDQNCGTCGTQCLPPPGGSVVATASCTSSQCVFTCPTDAGIVDGGGPIVQCSADSGAPGCFDLTSSSDHCGSCGTPCEGGATCTQSQCCPAGDSYCGGTCINVQTDTNNCGGCDAGCAAQCVGGMCVGYSQTNPTATFINACAVTGGMTGQLVNQSSWATSPGFALPFTFTFFGTAQTQAFLGTEGTLGFGAPTVFLDLPQCGQTAPFTNFAAVIAFGDQELATGPSGACYATVGTAPNQQFVATWEQASLFSDPSSVLTFSIILTQTTNSIDLVYQTASGADGGVDSNVGGASATVRLQAPATPELTASASCNKAFIPSTPYDIRFTPAQ
ncbi:MAG TPA: hypothetical protein VIJ22_08325 [Polyangiaceae bacterium]